MVYWFTRDYNLSTHPDADNISKKVGDGDGLEGIAYADDQQMRLRVAAVVDLGFGGEGVAGRLDEFDLSDAPTDLTIAIERLLSGPAPMGRAQAPSFTYIELGMLDFGRVRFGPEQPPRPEEQPS